jgi:hypothetical protein
LGAFDGGLADFGGKLGGSADCRTTTDAGQEGSASFSGGAAKQTGGAKGGDFGDRFEEGLRNCGSEGSAGRRGAGFGRASASFFFDLDLALNVFASQLRERSAGCAKEGTSYSAARASDCATSAGTTNGTSNAGGRAGQRACDSFAGCATDVAGAFDRKEWRAQFAGERGFSFACVADAACAAKFFKAGLIGKLAKTFGSREEGALELVNARSRAATKGRTDAELGPAPRLELLRVVLTEISARLLGGDLRIVRAIYVNGDSVVKLDADHRVVWPLGLTVMRGTPGAGCGVSGAA